MSKKLTGPDAAVIKAQIKNLEAHCRQYKQARVGDALFQLVTTLIGFTVLCAAMIWAVQGGFYWALLAALPAGGLLVRLFIVQHDCGHGSFFPSRKANDITGRFLSFFTWTPYAFWQRAHNMHHATSGNLDKRGIGSIDTLTVSEYQALSKRKRLLYRLYRNPFLLLVLGTPLHVFLIQRFPHGESSPFIGIYKGIKRNNLWKSIAGLDAALLIGYTGLIAAFGWSVLLPMLLPVLVAAWAGGWLFFIQHQFEEAYWEQEGEWSFHEAAILGSSYYDLPKVMQWFTGNIGLHHIHHLCSAVPNYRLQECLDANEFLQTMNRMTFKDSLECVRWSLWDEKAHQMIGFRDLRTAA